MLKILLTGLLFFMFFAAFAEEPAHIKTLLKKLPETTGKERKSVLKELTLFYYDTLAEKTIEYATEYLDLVKNVNLKDAAFMHSILGKAYHNQVNFKESLEHYLKSFEIYQKLGDENSSLSIQYYVGNAYLNLNEYQKSLDFTLPLVIIHKNKSDKKKMTSCLILAGKCYLAMDENGKALQIFREAEQNAIAEKYTDYIAWSRFWMGIANFKLGNLKIAQELHSNNIGLYISLGDIYGSLGSKQKLGDIYLLTGKFGEAYNLFFDSYENRNHFAGAKGENHFLATNYENLGKIFSHTGDFKKAIEYFDQGIRITENQNFDELKPRILYSKGICYSKMKDFDNASWCLDQALQAVVKARNNFEIAKILNGIGEIEQARHNCDQAIKTFTNALKINQQIGNKFGESQNHQNLATCYLKNKNFRLAKNHLDQGLLLAQKIDVDELLMGFYQLFTDYFNQTGNSVEEIKYLGLYFPLSEKVNKEDKMELTRLLVKYYQNQTEANTKVLQQEIELNKLDTERSDLKARIFLLVLIFTIILLLLGIAAYYRKLRTARKLEKMVDERTRKLSESEEKLREVTAIRERFFSIIAHDLKSPFSSLIGFTDLLDTEYENFSEKQRKEFIEIIRNSSEEIYALLENLLDWTRNSTEQVQFIPENTDLQQVAEQAILLLGKNAKIKNINIRNQIQENTLVFADNNMVMTVVRNLLSNAIKFTGNGGEIKMEAVKQEGSVNFSITDTGIGMSKETLETLFNISTQITQKGTNNEHGTGLGLLLCKDFLAKNGSEIKVESEVNKGTKFSFTLPAGQN